MGSDDTRHSYPTGSAVTAAEPHGGQTVGQVSSRVDRQRDGDACRCAPRASGRRWRAGPDPAAGRQITAAQLLKPWPTRHPARLGNLGTDRTGNIPAARHHRHRRAVAGPPPMRGCFRRRPTNVYGTSSRPLVRTELVHSPTSDRGSVNSTSPSSPIPTWPRCRAGFLFGIDDGRADNRSGR